jgi:hypothetical protein
MTLCWVVETDAKTGITTRRQVDLPVPTQAEGEAATAEADSVMQQAATNHAAIESGILGAFNDLRAFRDRTSTTLSVAQNIAILKTICRVLIWLGRLALKRLDAAS